MKFKLFKSWKVGWGDSLRQFLVVTAGIVVTFIGSDLISNHSTDKEIRSTMSLIIKELQSNNRDLAIFNEKHTKDRIIARYLVDSKFDVSRIPLDTLHKYKSFISQLSSFNYSEDALDVLKGSSLMQKIADKDMLLNLIETYQGFENAHNSVAEYYELKKSVIIPISLGTDQESWGDVYKSYERSLSVMQMQSFCMITLGFFDEGVFNNKVDKTDNFIAQLRAMYK